MPTLAPYEVDQVVYKKPSYAWGVYLIQEKLIALGYLDGEPDGIFGKGCESAVKKFQQDNGLEVTGKADLETQSRLDEQYKNR